jgi:hypothetical protein
MVVIVTAAGRVELQNPELEARLLEKHITAQAEAKAEQEMLSVSYRIDGDADPTVPFGGLLTTRLQICVRTARQLLADGRLAYSTVGQKKGYRVSERDIRAFEALLKQAS